MAERGCKYRLLFGDDIKPNMLKNFNRYQEMKKSWQNKNGKWVLVDNYHIGNWDNNKKSSIINDDFPEAIEYGGAIHAAFDGKKLIGFAFYDGRPIGSQKQYLWLVMLHVSNEYRHKGIGEKLFQMCVDSAKSQNAEKFYISANSSEESQAFYKAIGCIHAEEIIPELFEDEPYDVHMEYILEKQFL